MFKKKKKYVLNKNIIELFFLEYLFFIKVKIVFVFIIGLCFRNKGLYINIMIGVIIIVYVIFKIYKEICFSCLFFVSL